jgi:hypothetical protein
MRVQPEDHPTRNPVRSARSMIGTTTAPEHHGGLQYLAYTVARLRLGPMLLWSLSTRWPHGIEAQALALSDQVGPGIYQVRGDSTRDRSGSLV